MLTIGISSFSNLDSILCDIGGVDFSYFLNEFDFFLFSSFKAYVENVFFLNPLIDD